VNRDEDQPGSRRQTRWRFTTPAVLLLLRAGPAHGYDLLARLPEIFPRASEPPDPGAFYRLLRGLEADGAVTSSWTTGESGPARRVYALTELGVEQLEGWTLTIKREIDAMNRFLKAYASQPTGPQANSP